jgi:hypothetical protein
MPPDDSSGHSHARFGDAKVRPAAGEAVGGERFVSEVDQGRIPMGQPPLLLFIHRWCSTVACASYGNPDCFVGICLR